MAELTFKIKEKIGAVPAGDWTLELNAVSWNDREAKMEIRKWDSAHEKMGKGVTMTRDEAIAFLLKAPEMLKVLGVTPDVVIPEAKIEYEVGVASLPFD